MGVRARPKPKYKPRPISGPLPSFVVTAARWAAAWAVAALLVGVLLLLGKALPFARPSVQPGSPLESVFLVPVLTGAAAAAGLAIGLIYTGLMAATEEWRDSLERKDLLGRLGPYLLCGAAAGLIPGLLVGGLGGALFFAVLGACTAGAMNWRTVKR